MLHKPHWLSLAADVEQYGAFFHDKDWKDEVLESYAAVPDEYLIMHAYYLPTFTNWLRRVAHISGVVPYHANLLGHLAGPNALSIMVGNSLFQDLQNQLNFPESFSRVLLRVFNSLPKEGLKQASYKLLEAIPPGADLRAVSVRFRCDDSQSTPAEKYRKAFHRQRMTEEAKEKLKALEEFEKQCD